MTDNTSRPAPTTSSSLPPGVDFHLSVAPCSADNLTDDEVLHLAYQSEDPLVRRLAEVADPDPSEEESRTLSELWDLHAAVDHALGELSAITTSDPAVSIGAAPLPDLIKEVWQELHEAFDAVSTNE